ncbi:Fic family protein [Carnobacterium sp. TMP28]|uniref:Fic family protein n=1 Tax=Carnobacterium sp. TMP28 TaxID=3397060 RepID=UPI0039E099A6
MVEQGIKKLPIAVSIKEALEIANISAEVNYKIGKINSEFKHSIVHYSLIQILSLNESVQSTRIEGTQVTFTDMVEEKNDKNPRWEVVEIKNYQQALSEGVARIHQGYPISTRLIKELHLIMMQEARGSVQSSGDYRKIQNFIGPTNKLEDAVYIPVSANEINDYMENLEFFINGEKHSSFEKIIDEEKYVYEEKEQSLIKTAILHAQFESIHPFLDGNGRLGRILIVLNLIKDDLIADPVFFVSEELEKEKARYYDLLNGVRGKDPDWASWIKFFLTACNRMADQLINKFNKADALAAKGTEKLTLNSEKKVWIYSFSDPFATTQSVSVGTGLSKATARNALNSLVEKGLLYTDKQSKRNKKYRNYDLMRILRD